MPEYVDLTNPSWEWHFFCKTQLDNIQVWKLALEEDGIVRPIGYIVTRCFIDDIFLDSFLMIYGFTFFEKPSAEYIQKTYNGLESWAKGRKIKRIEALTSSPLMSGIAQAFGYLEDQHFVKQL